MLGKYISIVILIIMASFFLFLALGSFFSSDIPYEPPLYIFGTIIVILHSVLISILFYIADYLKEKL